MNNTKVSIIMPAYNAEMFIKESIESVLKQSYTEWELIIVDDCSSDDTFKIATEFAKKDKRILVFQNRTNKKVALTRNVAYSKATGRYLAFLDSDDLWTPLKLEKQLKMMKDKNASFVFGSYFIIDEDSKLTNKVFNAPTSIDYRGMLKGSKIGCLTVLLDMKNTSYPKMKNIGHEDYLAWLEILKNTDRAYAVTEPVAFYRVGKESLSGNKFKAASWQFKIYRDYLNLNLLESIYYFLFYICNGFFKYSTKKSL